MVVTGKLGKSEQYDVTPDIDGHGENSDTTFVDLLKQFLSERKIEK